MSVSSNTKCFSSTYHTDDITPFILWRDICLALSVYLSVSPPAGCQTPAVQSVYHVNCLECVCVCVCVSVYVCVCVCVCVSVCLQHILSTPSSPTHVSNQAALTLLQSNEAKVQI